MKENSVEMTDIDHRESRQGVRSKGLYLFYLFPLFYVMSVYLIPVFAAGLKKGDMLSFLVYLPVLLGVVNIIVCIRFCKPGNRIMLLNGAVFIKYALIPFYIVGGLALMITFLMSFIPVPFMIFLFLPVSAIGAVAGWLILALGAPYTISYLRLSVKEGTCPKRMAVICGILQFFFTVDVIAVMVLAWREHKWRKLSIAIIVMLAAAMVILLILCLFGIVGMIMQAGQ